MNVGKEIPGITGNRKGITK